MKVFEHTPILYLLLIFQILKIIFYLKFKNVTSHICSHNTENEYEIMFSKISRFCWFLILNSSFKKWRLFGNLRLFFFCYTTLNMK